MNTVTRNAIIALGITLLIAGTIVYTVHYINQQRLSEINTMQTQLSTDTLSLETQFALLENVPCKDISSNTVFSRGLSTIGDKLSFAEQRLGKQDQQVIELKKEYSLLEIRDYLLMQKFSDTCHITPITVLYFYSNTGDCSSCDRAGYALSYMRKTYPRIRVYSFDYHLDLGALKTLIEVKKIKPTLPAFVIQKKRFYGFTSLAQLEKEFPKELFASSTATSTNTRIKQTK